MSARHLPRERSRRSHNRATSFDTPSVSRLTHWPTLRRSLYLSQSIVARDRLAAVLYVPTRRPMTHHGVAPHKGELGLAGSLSGRRLALLLIQAKQLMKSDQLVDELLGEQRSASALNALRVTI